MYTNFRKAFAIPKDLFITNIETDLEIIVSCQTKKRKQIVRCLLCTKKMRKFGKTNSRVLHNCISGKSLYLHIRKQKYQCTHCNTIQLEQIDGINNQRMSDHFIQLIQEKSRNQDFSSVAREMNISPATVMRKQDELELCQFVTPAYEEVHLGIDGKYLNGEHEIFVIGDVKQKDFFGITKDNNMTVLRQILQSKLLDQEKKVVVVSIDMCKRFKGLADTLFPDADIVVDKFHVIKYINSTIDLCRVAVEQSNNERFGIKRLLLMKVSTFKKIEHKPKWEYKVRYFKKLLIKHPEIKILWTLKNMMHTFYNSKSRKTAEKRFQAMLDYLDAHRKTHPEFRDLKKTLETWQKYILNHFDTGITNAYIEGINNRIETLKRKKCGYRNVERFLRSVVFGLLPIITFISNPIFINQL